MQWVNLSTTAVHTEKQDYMVYKYQRGADLLTVVDYTSDQKIVVNYNDNVLELDYDTWNTVASLIYEGILW